MQHVPIAATTHLFLAFQLHNFKLLRLHVHCSWKRNQIQYVWVAN